MDKFETFSKQVGKTKALQVEIESGGKQLVVPCRLKIIFKTLRNLDVETMNLDAELTILTWIGLDGLDRKNPDQARQLKMINWQVGCHPKETPFPKLESGETDPDYLGLPTGGRSSGQRKGVPHVQIFPECRDAEADGGRANSRHHLPRNLFVQLLR